MGEAEINFIHQIITIHSHFITYGDAADEQLTENIRAEIETMWNEPQATVVIKRISLTVVFSITAKLQTSIDTREVISNTNPRNNYFRIEKFARGNISFVDGLGCNSGYFLTENLYIGSTTAAHEYGHTLGLHHPVDIDYRGKGVPRIMYPRGTLVDAPYQYDPSKPAGVTGGTMHPMYRKVFAEDIALLNLERLRFKMIEPLPVISPMCFIITMRMKFEIKSVACIIHIIWGSHRSSIYQLQSGLYVTSPAQNQRTNLHRVFHCNPAASDLRIKISSYNHQII